MKKAWKPIELCFATLVIIFGFYCMVISFFDGSGFMGYLFGAFFASLGTTILFNRFGGFKVLGGNG